MPSNSLLYSAERGGLQAKRGRGREFLWKDEMLE